MVILKIGALSAHVGIDGHIEDIDDDIVVDMMCTYEVANSQPKDNNEKGDEFQDVVDAILQGIIQGNNDKGVEDVEPKLTKTFDEVGDAMDGILKGTDEKSHYENEGNPEPEFTEGNTSNVLPEMCSRPTWGKISMAEIESMRGVQLELDDMPPVEMDIPYVYGVMEGNEGDGIINDGVEANDGDGEGAGEGDGEDNQVYIEGNDVDNERHVQHTRTRKPQKGSSCKN
uniref:Uncharacterized protein n=1 Tax=Lactuca sativa TaxID=4236 RepID=A0A9R1W1S5_LACSA|nr:hypothetical protein LSAT_V11C300118440 [Lactuca sativa]